MGFHNVLYGDGELNLVWKFGTGHFKDKKKMREIVRDMDISHLSSIVYGYVPAGLLSSEPKLNLKSLAILMRGLCVMHQSKVDMLLEKSVFATKNVQNSLVAWRKETGDVESSHSAKRVKPQVDSTHLQKKCRTEEIPYQDEILDLIHSHMDLEELQAYHTGTNPKHSSKRVKSPIASDRLQKRRRTGTGETQDENEIPDAEEILDLLHTSYTNLDPMANLLIDPQLPPQPIMEGDGFGTIEPVDLQDILSLFNTPAGGVNFVETEIQPVEAHVLEDVNNVPEVQGNTFPNAKLPELDCVEKTMKTRRRRKQIIDKTIELSSDVLRSWVGKSVEEYLEENYRGDRYPTSLMYAVSIGELNAKFPQLSPIALPPSAPIMDTICGSGRKTGALLGNLQKMLNPKPFVPRHPVSLEMLVESWIQTFQNPLSPMSQSNSKSSTNTLGNEVHRGLGQSDLQLSNPISGHQLDSVTGEEVLMMQLQEELGLDRLEATEVRSLSFPETTTENVINIEKALERDMMCCMEQGNDLHQQPLVTRRQAKSRKAREEELYPSVSNQRPTTFADIARGKSRKHASRLFVKYLDLQRSGEVFMIQEIPFGPIEVISMVDD